MVGDFYTPLSTMDRLFRDSTRKGELSNTGEQMKLKDIDETLYPTTAAEYTFFSSTNATFSKSMH